MQEEYLRRISARLGWILLILLVPLIAHTVAFLGFAGFAGLITAGLS